MNEDVRQLGLAITDFEVVANISESGNVCNIHNNLPDLLFFFFFLYRIGYEGRAFAELPPTIGGKQDAPNH